MNINTIRIAIIGCGWLGLPLAELLIEKEYLVSGSTTSSDKIPKLKGKGIDPFLISFPNNIKDLKAFLQADIIIVNIPPGRKNPYLERDYPAYIRTIIENIPQSSKVLFISSTSVYGNAKGEVTELSPRNPVSSSGKALVEVEDFLVKKLNMASGDAPRATILRFGGLVGGERHPGRFLAGKKEVKNGDAPVNLIYRKDCIQCIYEIIRQKKWGENYNLSADKHPTKKSLYIKANIDLDVEPPTFLDGGSDLKRINNSKIKKDLGIQLMHPDPLRFADR